MSKDAPLRFRKAMNSPEFRGAKRRAYSITSDRITSDRGMIVERDVEIPTRFGHILYADVFRPEAGGPAPPLIAWTPYGKHDPAPLAKIYPGSGVRPEWMSDYTIFEAPDPVYWTAQGYAVVTIDIPGTWYATADARYMDPVEAEAFYDAIEWAGTQPWSNGKVGLSGVSYLTVMQWRVAELNPPHLAAINPYEGWTDTYREVAYHGGIPETYFWPYIQTRWGASDRRIEDLWRETIEHPFFDAFWERKAAQLERIRVPAYVVASWSDHGLHTRGTLEGYRRIASEHKWLEVHGQKKWQHYYDPASLTRQKAFFDHFLKGIDTGLPTWPKVQVEVRDAAGIATVKTATAWPPPETEYVRLYLDAASSSLSLSPPSPGEARYEPLDEDQRAVFDYRFEADTELVGHMTLNLRVSATESDDMDLFVAIQKLDANGELVGFVHYAVFEDGPVALGWLRVSHREIDANRSTDYLPVLKHARWRKLSPGEIASVRTEIQPSGTRFRAGETLRLIIAGRDLYQYPKPMLYARHEDSVNRGEHIIHTGGADPAFLLAPFTRLARG